MEETTKRILLRDFLIVDDPDHTKVKFNMNSSNIEIRAWDNLRENNEDAVDDKWIKMNAHRKKHANNNLDKADYLLSFAQYYPLGPDYYIFGGYYKVTKIIPEVMDGTGYTLELQDKYKEYRKRLIIRLRKSIGRDLYNRWYNNVQDSLNPEVYEIAPSTELGVFPGYYNIHISHSEMQSIIKGDAKDWKEALSYVKGVYCITDTRTGQLYIGSAYGAEGIWGRWKNYADINNLTGGNKAFEEMKNNGADRIIDYFRYSIIEIFDIRAKDNDIIERESYWKRVFDTRAHGMNKN